MDENGKETKCDIIEEANNGEDMNPLGLLALLLFGFGDRFMEDD